MSSAPLRGGRAGGTAAVGASGPAVPPGAAAGKRGGRPGAGRPVGMRRCARAARTPDAAHAPWRSRAGCAMGRRREQAVPVPCAAAPARDPPRVP